MSENHSRPSCQRGPSGNAKPARTVSKLRAMFSSELLVAPTMAALTQRRHRPAPTSRLSSIRHDQGTAEEARMDGETGTLQGVDAAALAKIPPALQAVIDAGDLSGFVTLTWR